jgi:hypothetical protein
MGWPVAAITSLGIAAQRHEDVVVVRVHGRASPRQIWEDRDRNPSAWLAPQRCPVAAIPNTGGRETRQHGRRVRPGVLGCASRRE